MDFDFINPPENPDSYLYYRKDITNKCKELIQDCENGRIINKYPYTEQQRTEALINILQNKVLQLKIVVDSKNAILEKQKEQIIKGQKKLLEYESFNVWESIEYFGDWKAR